MSSALLSQLSDERLVALVRAGRDDAFGAIHTRYHDRLLAFARRLLTGTGHDAEDVVQDAFIRALGGLRATGAEMNLKPWLYMIVRNLAMDELRKPARVAAELDDVVHLHPAEDADPALRAIERELLHSVVAAIAEVPERQRRARGAAAAPAPPPARAPARPPQPHRDGGDARHLDPGDEVAARARAHDA